MPSVHTVFAVLALLILDGCDRATPTANYFPLEPGRHWQYRVERTTMDGRTELRHAVRAVAVPPGLGIDAMRETLGGLRYLYAIDDDGIFRIDAAAAGPRHGAGEVSRELVLPHAVDAASTWQTWSQTTVLENTGPPWETLFRINAPIRMRYQVEAIDGAVTTPAGRFDDCLVVAGRGTASVDVGNYIGRTRIEVASREWFAPGVGLVRMEREEKTGADALRAGRLVMELDQWQRR